MRAKVGMVGAEQRSVQMSLAKVDPETQISKMRSLLETQRAVQLRAGAPSAAVRKDRIDRCIKLLTLHKDEITEAMNADFGARSKDMSLLTDVAGSIGPLKNARDSLDRWMKAEKRKVEAPLGLMGAKAEVRFQPKGVIGIISPYMNPV